MSIKTLKNEFLKYLERDLRRSAKTLEAYDLYLSRFVSWLEKERVSSLAKVNEAMVKRYKGWLKGLRLENGKKLGAKTINYHLIALRMLFVFARRKNKKILSPSLIELGDQSALELVFLTNRELVKLLDAPMASVEFLSEKVLIQLRDKAVLEFLFATGVKINDVVGFKKSDLKYFKLGQQAQYWIKKYLDNRADKLPFLFVSYDRARNVRNQQAPSVAALTPRSLQRIVKKYSVAAGLDKKVTPQVLRNTFGRRLLDAGATVKEMQKAMGFASELAAKIYVDSLKRADGLSLRACPPLWRA